MLTVIKHQDYVDIAKRTCDQFYKDFAVKGEAQGVITTSAHNLLLIQSYLATLSRCHQIVSYHRLVGYNAKLTAAITSLTEEEIKDSYRTIARGMYKHLNAFDFNIDKETFVRMSLLDEQLKDLSFEDYKIAELFEIELGVIKILKHLSQYHSGY